VRLRREGVNRETISLAESEGNARRERQGYPLAGKGEGAKRLSHEQDRRACETPVPRPIQPFVYVVKASSKKDGRAEPKAKERSEVNRTTCDSKFVMVYGFL